MNRIVLVLFSFFVVGQLSAQRKLTGGKGIANDSIDRSLSNPAGKRKSSKFKKNKDATIDLYKIISKDNDTTYLDTTLTIKKEYKFNYLRKDNFDLLAFNNLGQTYNSLSHDFSGNKLMPLFGARARHFNFIEGDDVNYYYVPTPLTELMYKSAFTQGQLLDAFFTVNTSKQFNVSIAYKGLRSLGKYQNTLTSTGNFRFTTNYKTKNDRYHLRAHTVIQDLLNEENGGLLDTDLEKFESGNPEFTDRSVFDPAFQDAESILKGRRFHLDHYYKLIHQKDSTVTNTLSLGNKLTFEDRFFRYEQDKSYAAYGAAFNDLKLYDKVEVEEVYAEANATYTNNILGVAKFNVGYSKYNYGYNKLVFVGGNTITNRLKGDVLSIGGAYKKQIGDFLLDGKFGLNVSGDLDGNYFEGKASYDFKDFAKVQAKLNINSKAPNYNYQLYQSDYVNYNWQNNFKNVQTKQLSFVFESDKLFNAEVDYSTINNHTYFAISDTDNLIKPNQYDNTINYLRVKLEKEFKLNKFALHNTLRYQKVTNGEGILNVPELVLRSTLYYSNHFFEKKALFLQTGITFNYFTKYNMNGYDPVLAEFYTQNKTEIGGFPRLDFFINAKVRQTRIFLKAEHFNSSFTGYNFYSAPNYPYRDFVVRFGLVWNFFL